MIMKRAMLMIGVQWQDGLCLVKPLLEKGN
jgi:hypothetical protein